MLKDQWQKEDEKAKQQEADESDLYKRINKDIQDQNVLCNHSSRK